MLKGMIKAANPAEMNLLHSKILDVMANVGLIIHSRKMLEALADSGCKVDFSHDRVWFKPEVVEKQIAGQRSRYKMVRSSLWYPFCREMPDDDVAFADDFCLDFGHATPSIYDYATDSYRAATSKDQLEMIKLGNALDAVKAVCAPVIATDFPAELETVLSAQLLLTHCLKPGWVGTSNGKEVKYLAAMSSLATDGNKSIAETAPPVFVHAYCTTSPLKIDNRSCEVLEEAIKYRFPINFASMPILGATTPVTPAGSAVVAAAEILGGITAASLLDDTILYYGTSISGEIDMKTTAISYSSPAAILTDVILHQLFRFKYGLVLNVEPAYCEAKKPGLQAAFVKTFRQMAFAATVSQPLPVGLLDNGSVFSPLQAMLDLDFNYGMFKFSRGAEISEKTIGVDTIKQLAFCEGGTTYLDCDHTIEYFRDVLWDSRYLDRTYRESDDKEREKAKGMLDKAEADWRGKVASQTDESPRPSAFLRELDKIAKAAKTEFSH